MVVRSPPNQRTFPCFGWMRRKQVLRAKAGRGFPVEYVRTHSRSNGDSFLIDMASDRIDDILFHPFFLLYPACGWHTVIRIMRW